MMTRTRRRIFLPAGLLGCGPNFGWNCYVEVKNNKKGQFFTLLRAGGPKSGCRAIYFVQWAEKPRG